MNDISKALKHQPFGKTKPPAFGIGEKARPVATKNKTSEKIKAKLRLKGDWLDHLKGDQWSFRVETASDKSWNRLKTFSIQNPPAPRL